jgi:ferritin-like metal-binding protein YciE
VARGIDGAAKEVEGIEIEQYTTEKNVANSFRWTFLGIILGVLFTLIVTRRKRKQISIEKVNDEVDVRLEKLEQVLNTLQEDKPKPKLIKSPPKSKKARAPKKKTRR